MSGGDASPFPFSTAAVIGLGLIGGSVARDLAAAGVRVLGADLDRRALRQAVASGAVHLPLEDDLAGIEEADVVLVAVPVSRARSVLGKIAAQAHGARLVTDSGSTKKEMMRSARAVGLGPRFVGGHPLAGDHRAGWEASRRGLFAGQTAYLCRGDADPAAVDLARALWGGLGAHVSEVEAGDHDRRLAWTSHLPQLLSTALAHVLEGEGIGRDELGPGGQSMTRLAGSDSEMWTGIIGQNAARISEALGGIESAIQRLRTAIEAGDEASIRGILEEGKRWSDRSPS